MTWYNIKLGMRGNKTIFILNFSLEQMKEYIGYLFKK